ncbi:uncharacterized protein TA02605 [Theileria annulata]|uniref:RED-like N-terminal domain-containing protein n=1 Tax=Theileria annulata TaxID=5874 RepID=Q4UD24_THEAN|nr:uncharacterized protein TA02605 [Theileria annulata]CAI75277.1 hypothetical protein, conserved [Theileria annulata]|eukprot:XP_954753.1 hypothetical protein, conserved [Theileria annulata]
MVNKSDFNAVLSKVGIPPSLQKKRGDKIRRKPQPKRETEQYFTGFIQFLFRPPEDGVKYRNRALERSQLKEEYKRVQEEFELLRTQTEEESRYMGGDIEYTHLVKGLDYALLEKIKKQLTTPTAIETKDSVPSSTDSDLGMGFTEFGFYLYKNFFYHTNVNNINFKQRLNNTIHLLEQGKYKLKTHNNNLIYNFNVGNNYQFLPNFTTNDTFNSESDDNANSDNKVFITTEQELLDVFNWHMENKKKKKEERLPFRPEIKTINTNKKQSDLLIGENNDKEESDDDIYEGIGTYNSNEFNVEALNELEGNIFEIEKEEKTTYKVPEKLLKRHKTKLNEPDVDLDFDDGDDEAISNKKGKKNKNWDEIEKIIKDKNPSLDKFKTSETKATNIKFL